MLGGAAYGLLLRRVRWLYGDFVKFRKNKSWLLSHPSRAEEQRECKVSRRHYFEDRTVVDETESGRRPVQVPISGLNQGTIGKEPWGPSN
jgi:hypothetical protein